MKSIKITTALAICALSASPVWAAEALTDGQMDAVTAGYEFGPFVTTR